MIILKRFRLRYVQSGKCSWNDRRSLTTSSDNNPHILFLHHLHLHLHHYHQIRYHYSNSPCTIAIAGIPPIMCTETNKYDAWLRQLAEHLQVILNQHLPNLLLLVHRASLLCINKWNPALAQAMICTDWWNPLQGLRENFPEKTLFWTLPKFISTPPPPDRKCGQLVLF